jgi:hypothetical protein
MKPHKQSLDLGTHLRDLDCYALSRTLIGINDSQHDDTEDSSDAEKVIKSALPMEADNEDVMSSTKGDK